MTLREYIDQRSFTRRMLDTEMDNIHEVCLEIKDGHEHMKIRRKKGGLAETRGPIKAPIDKAIQIS